MSSEPSATILARAHAFRDDDPDPDTQAELDALLSRNDEAALRERFSSSIAFGTAGLRGLLGAGDNRMNLRVVAQASAALCAYLQQSSPEAQRRGLCIGFDGRHKSREFAQEVAAVANGAGFLVHAFEAVAPTPLLAFAVRERAAAAGVMITASHNPAGYNGYKVYLDNGAQLIEPHDRAIAALMAASAPVLSLPRLSRDAATQRGLWRSLQGVEISYLRGLRAELKEPRGPVPLRIAYSALHGVGQQLAERALEVAGVSGLFSVREQAAPDPDFPGLPFPNPEEPGTLDLLLMAAETQHTDLAIANDPDADRLAVAARDKEGVMRVLDGNQVGVLLADYLLGQAPDDGRNLVISSIVSTPLVGRIAAAHGARSEVTLTGFKWIMQRAAELETEAGLRCVLGFEEALGYCIGSLVRDKDGVAAAAHVARMAAWHAQRGRDLWGALEALYRKHGLYTSRQVSVQLADARGVADMQACMQRLRDNPPTRVADLAVSARLDLLNGVATRNGVQSAASLPKSDVLCFELADAQRITLRPSGTEPKLKLYLDCLSEFGEADSFEVARTRGAALADRLATAFLDVAGLDVASRTR
jgi:phosphomannomutase